MTASNVPPDEMAFSSPNADETRPTLSGMPPAWQSVYDHLREAHAAAIVGSQDKPGDLEAAEILKASVAAVRAFRQVYQEASTASIARQMNNSDQP